MRTVTVTIGRNIGDDPMPAEQWNHFIAKTRETVSAYSDSVFAAAPYKGEWDGVTEDAFIVLGGGVTDNGLVLLASELETLATKYRQDAIGFSVGDGRLIEPFSVDAPVYATA